VFFFFLSQIRFHSFILLLLKTSPARQYIEHLQSHASRYRHSKA